MVKENPDQTSVTSGQSQSHPPTPHDPSIISAQALTVNPEHAEELMKSKLEMVVEQGPPLGEEPGTAPASNYFLEEAEVLPYESVFEWDVEDPIGFYKEDEKYQELDIRFQGDELKLAVVEGMWRDRVKYQVLRRFFWPPKLFFDQFFWSRGYYEDYEPRPTVDIATLHLLADAKRMKKEARLRAAGEHRDEIDPNILKIRPGSLSDFDPLLYHRNILEVDNLPNDIDLATLQKLFPTGKIELVDDGKGGKRAFIEYPNFNAARAAYKKALKADLNGVPLDITGKKRVPPGVSLTEFDPAIYNRQKLEIKNLPKDTDHKLLQNLFNGAKLTFTKNPDGTENVVGEFKNFDAARKAFRKAADTKIGGKPVVVTPQKWLGPGRNLKDYDPALYNRQILEVKDLPADVSEDELRNIFGPFTNFSLVDNGRGGKDLTVEYGSFKDAQAAFKKAIAAKIKGAYMDVNPQKKRPGSLSEFDPEVYNREVLTMSNLPIGEDEARKLLEGLFPGKEVAVKNNANGGVDAAVQFDSFEDARAPYKKAINTKVGNDFMDVIPLRVGGGAGGRGSQGGGGKSGGGGKGGGKQGKKKKPPQAVITGQKKSLTEFDPEIYNTNVLLFRGIPKDVGPEYFTKMFPTAMPPPELRDDLQGGQVAILEFENPDDARNAFKKALQTKLRKNPLNVLPMMKSPTGTDKNDVIYANPYTVKAKYNEGKNLDPRFTGYMPVKINRIPLRTAEAEDKGKDNKKKEKKEKTFMSLKAYPEQDYDYLTLEVHNIRPGTQQRQLEEKFPKGKVQKMQYDFDIQGKQMAIITFKYKDDAMAAFKDNHEQYLNNEEMQIWPSKKGGSGPTPGPSKANRASLKSTKSVTHKAKKKGDNEGLKAEVVESEVAEVTSKTSKISKVKKK